MNYQNFPSNFYFQYIAFVRDKYPQNDQAVLAATHINGLKVTI